MAFFWEPSDRSSLFQSNSSWPSHRHEFYKAENAVFSRMASEVSREENSQFKASHAHLWWHIESFHFRNYHFSGWFRYGTFTVRIARPWNPNNITTSFPERRQDFYFFFSNSFFQGFFMSVKDVWNIFPWTVLILCYIILLLYTQSVFSNKQKSNRI